MKTISTEFQNELINYFQAAQGLDIQVQNQFTPAYFLEELRPKRVRKKLVITDNAQPFTEGENVVDNQ